MIKFYTLIDDTKAIIDEKFKDKLWTIKESGCNYGDEYDDPRGIYPWSATTVMYGKLIDVEKYTNLTCGSNTKIETYNIYKHGIPKEILNAKEEYDKSFVPKSAGDIIEFNNKQYKVTGFYCDEKGRFSVVNIHDDKDRFDLTKKDNFEMIESEYWKCKRIFG